MSGGAKILPRVGELLRQVLAQPGINGSPPVSATAKGCPLGLGIGAVLSHVMEDGTEKSIAFASRTLAPSEKRYSQLDKEALASMFGVKRFHQYLYGRQFIIHSDHKPLMFIFEDSKAVPPTASARIQRWALTLSGYTYHIRYRAGREHANADGLSRLPLPEAPAVVPQPAETVLLMEHLPSSPVSGYGPRLGATRPCPKCDSS